MAMPDLKELRDIHPPLDPTWWPPAVGWWLVLVCLLVIVVTAPQIKREWQRVTERRQTLRKLQKLNHRCSNTLDDGVASDLSLLLRDVAQRRHQNFSSAGLTGPAWLDFLSRTGQGDNFHTDTGRRLLDTPYQQKRNADMPALLELAGRWIRHNA